MWADKQVGYLLDNLRSHALTGVLVRLYFNGLGGNHQILFWLTFIGGLILYEVLTVLQTWFLGYWARQYEEMPASEVKVS